MNVTRFDSALGWNPRSVGAKVSRAIVCLLLIVVFGIPFLTIISGAFSHNMDPTKLTLFPTSPTLDNFVAGGPRGLYNYFFRSLVIAGGGLLLQMTASVMAGYALSRQKFRGQALVFALFLLTLMLPEEVIAIPLSLVLGHLPLLGTNLKGTVWGVILPVGIWGFSIMVMTEFMRDIPEEICEAARLDGLGEFQILGRIVLPLIKPALGVVGIFGFIMIWNQYLLPLIASDGPKTYTLTVALNTLRDDPNVGTGLIAAGSFLALLPSLIVYLLLQSSLIRGISAGSGK
jgi:multiple sugar transport system permease protein